MKKYLLLLWVVGLFASCEEDQIETYSATSPDGISGVYFQFMESYIANSSGQVLESRFVDSISRNFISFPAEKELTVGLPVKMMGYPVDYDRKISVRVNQKLTDCTEGEDFVLKYDGIVIPAGSVQTVVPVILKRTALLQTRACRVAVDLIGNEYFSILMDKYNDNTIPGRSKTQYDAGTFKVIFSNIVTADNIGSYFMESYFGTWSIEKFNVINSQTGWTLENWVWAGSSSRPSPVSLTTLPYAAYKAQRYLQAEADRGFPVREVDGSFVQLGPNYTVDYSAYE